MAESIVYKSGIGEYERRQKEVEKDPNLEAVTAEWASAAKKIEDRKDAAHKNLNAEWSESFKPGGRSKALAYHERSEAISRDYQGALTELKRELFSKYGLGDIPVSEYEYRLYLEYKDPRTAELDKLRVRRARAYRAFEDSLLDEITKAGGAKNLSYDKEGELDKFSVKTQNLYKAYKDLDKKISGLRTDYPAEVSKGTSKSSSGVPDLQAIHDSRSPRSRESDERQSNADTIESDDPRVERWLKDQGRMDVSGIDAPKKHKGKKVARKTRKSTRTETQVRGIRR